MLASLASMLMSPWDDSSRIGADQAPLGSFWRSTSRFLPGLMLVSSRKKSYSPPSPTPGLNSHVIVRPCSREPGCPAPGVSSTSSSSSVSEQGPSDFSGPTSSVKTSFSLVGLTRTSSAVATPTRLKVAGSCAPMLTGSPGLAELPDASRTPPSGVRTYSSRSNSLFASPETVSSTSLAGSANGTGLTRS